MKTKHMMALGMVLALFGNAPPLFAQSDPLGRAMDAAADEAGRAMVRWFAEQLKSESERRCFEYGDCSAVERAKLIAAYDERNSERFVGKFFIGEEITGFRSSSKSGKNAVYHELRFKGPFRPEWADRYTVKICELNKQDQRFDRTGEQGLTVIGDFKGSGGKEVRVLKESCAPPRDERELPAWLEKFARGGDVDAQYRLGLLREKDAKPEEAARWYEQAALQGHAQARYSLALVLMARGLPQADREALRHLRALADDGKADHDDLKEKARRELDALYKAGRGVPEDPAGADAYWAEAAERGNAEGMYRVALARERAGNGGAAAELYEKAAREGHLEAMYKFGMSRLQSRDDAGATLWLGRAADRGHSEAGKRVDALYAEKRGQPQGEKENAEYLRNAAKRGHEWARLRYAELLASARAELDAFAAKLERFRGELAAAGTSDWAQDKPVEEWQALGKTLSDLSARAHTDDAGVSALAARLSSVAPRTHSDVEAALNDRAETLKTDFEALTGKIAAQLAIVTGQARLRTLADNRKALAEGARTVPELFERKRARCAEIRNLRSRIIQSRQQGFADLDELAGQAEALKARSLREGAEEQGIGKRVKGLAGGWQRIFGTAAINKLKRDLPEPSAQARIDAERAALGTALGLKPNADPAGAFTNLESKALQISDRMEEDKLVKNMEDALNRIRREAGRR